MLSDFHSIHVTKRIGKNGKKSCNLDASNNFEDNSSLHVYVTCYRKVDQYEKKNLSDFSFSISKILSNPDITKKLGNLAIFLFEEKGRYFLTSKVVLELWFCHPFPTTTSHNNFERGKVKRRHNLQFHSSNKTFYQMMHVSHVTIILMQLIGKSISNITFLKHISIFSNTT